MLKSVCFSDALTFRELNGPNRRGRPRRHWVKTAIEDCWQGLATEIVGPGGNQCQAGRQTRHILLKTPSGVAPPPRVQSRRFDL